jgi:hypothetical protein
MRKFLRQSVALLTIVSISMLFPSITAAQLENHLIVKKKGYIDKMHFLTGDPITLVRAGGKSAEETIIEGIGKDYIIISGQELPLSEIAVVWHHRTTFNFVASGRALQVAAPGYLIIGMANSLFQGTSIVPTTTNLIVAGSLLTAGTLMPRLQVKRYPIGRRFTLRVVQSDPWLNR